MLLLLTVVLAVALPVALPVGVAVPVGELVGVVEPVGDAVMDTVPELEAEAPSVKEPVGLCDRVELPLSVEEGVSEAVPVPDCVGELDGVPVPVCVGVMEPLKEALPVLEADAPDVREPVGLWVCVELPLRVEEGV